MTARHHHAVPRIDRRWLRRNIRARAQREIVNSLAQMKPKVFKARFKMSYSWSRIDHGANIEFHGDAVTFEDEEQDLTGYIYFGRFQSNDIYPMFLEFRLDEQYAAFLFVPSPNGLILRQVSWLTEC